MEGGRLNGGPRGDGGLMRWELGVGGGLGGGPKGLGEGRVG